MILETPQLAFKLDFNTKFFYRVDMSWFHSYSDKCTPASLGGEIFLQKYIFFEIFSTLRNVSSLKRRGAERILCRRQCRKSGFPFVRSSVFPEHNSWTADRIDLIFFYYSKSALVVPFSWTHFHPIKSWGWKKSKSAPFNPLSTESRVFFFRWSWKHHNLPSKCVFNIKSFLQSRYVMVPHIFW